MASRQFTKSELFVRTSAKKEAALLVSKDNWGKVGFSVAIMSTKNEDS